MRARSAEYSQGPYSEEEEVRAMNIDMGNAKTESNGHGVDRLEKKDLEETMRSLKIEVLDFHYDNERLIKDQH